ncbi:MAG: hypothetical protein SynsKO_42030 [Synoicihabitans sp.]
MRMLLSSPHWFRWGLWGPALAMVLVLGGCQSPTTKSENASGEDVAGAESPALSDETEAEIAAAREEAREANRQLELDRQALQFAAWRHLKAISNMWSELPPEFFPGLTSLVAEIEDLSNEIESEGKILVGQIEPEALTIRNPSFWRAVMETNPEDPVVDMFEQMLWAARGDFDRSLWLIELHRYGPALPANVHKILYTMADEMRRLSARKTSRRNQLLENLPPQEIVKVVATARGFQPGDPDWALMEIIVRLQMANVPIDNLSSQQGLVDELMRQMRDEWEVVARANPMMAARLSPSRDQRAAAESLADLLNDLGESRGAWGGRDVVRLGEALAEAGFYAEALLAKQRATALRGFSVPSDMQAWWKWLPEMIGEEETQKLEMAALAGEIRPVTFFQSDIGPEGVSLLPLHPILTERNLRRIQEVQRRLEKPDLNAADKTRALITLAETRAHLGRWDEAINALDEIPEEFADAGAPMRVWIALWSGRVSEIETHVAALDQKSWATTPALPALAKAATGNWAEGAQLFMVSAENEDVAKEYRTYYTLMASAFKRMAGQDGIADQLIERARELGEGHDWVSTLVQGMAGEAQSQPVGNNITQITEAGRICEQRFYRAFQADLSPERRRALLEGCVSTGVVDFVEYTASLLRLRELDPERWDPSLAPESVEPAAESEEDEKDWTRGAAPKWSIPS